ncbi:unnamed protein product [Trichobilharzia szidati]|nr:unnamed protein product [Trichobilharzia szidati]
MNKCSGCLLLLLLLLLSINLLPICSSEQLEKNYFADTVKARCTQWAIEHNVLDIDCDDIWQSFEKILHDARNQSECVMQPTAYDEFVENAFKKQPKIENAHFYSQAFDVIRAMCRRLGECSSLETTLPGYLFDELDWCEKNFTGDADYGTSCGCNETTKVVFAFWESASKKYAQIVSGNVFVVLNGSVAWPFKENGTFATVELPELLKTKVQKITVKLIHNTRKSPYHHTCESPNIKKLESIVKSKMISYQCINDPPEFKHFLCINDQTSKECRFSSSSRRTSYTYLLLSSCLFLYYTFTTFSSIK